MPDYPHDPAPLDHGDPALLGRRIRELRKAAGLTLDRAAEATGLSRAALSKIERGEMSPTYDSLCKLARGLRVDLATLVSGHSPTGGGVAVTHAGEGAEQRTNRFVHRLIAPGLADRAMYAFESEVRVTDVAAYDRWDRHDSEDMLYVLEGRIAVHLDGHDPVELGPGDALQMDCRIPHAIVAVPTRDEPEPVARMLWVSVPARR